VNTQLFLESDGWGRPVLGPPQEALARRLAHELRNPLAPIATAAELLLQQNSDERTRHLGFIIERHAAQLRTLVDELIAAANAGLSFKAAPWTDGGCGGVSNPGQGGDRQLSLPLNEEGMPSTHVPPEPDLRLPAVNALRVLVVDDNADAAHVMGLFLQSLGHVVCVLTDPLAAVAAAAQFKPQIGLLDIAMPGLDGHELARRLRQMPTNVDLRLAAVSAYSHPSERHAAARSGFEHYFVKPLDVSALQLWLEQTAISAVA